MINYDGLVNAPLKQVARGTYALVDTIQDFPPHLQVAAAAVLCLKVCEVHRANPNDVFTAVKNMLNRADETGQAELRALDLYVRGELR